MYQEFYNEFVLNHLMVLPLFAMGLFLLAFAAILYWVFVHLRDSPMPDYMAQLPLSDEPIRQTGQEALTDEQ